MVKVYFMKQFSSVMSTYKYLYSGLGQEVEELLLLCINQAEICRVLQWLKSEADRPCPLVGFTVDI